MPVPPEYQVDKVKYREALKSFQEKFNQKQDAKLDKLIK